MCESHWSKMYVGVITGYEKLIWIKLGIAEIILLTNIWNFGYLQIKVVILKYKYMYWIDKYIQTRLRINIIYKNYLMY